MHESFAQLLSILYTAVLYIWSTFQQANMPVIVKESERNRSQKNKNKTKQKTIVAKGFQ